MESSVNNYSIFDPRFYLCADIDGFGEREALEESQASNDEGSANVVPGPIKALPPKILARIFSCLYLADFGKGCQVSQTWNKQLTSDPELVKQIVYHDNIAMSPEKWEGHCGNDVIRFEEFKERAYKLLSKNIFKILKTPCQAFAPEAPKVSLFDMFWNCLPTIIVGSTPEGPPVKKIGETSVLVYVDESFTINLLGQLFKQCFPNNANGYQYINPVIVNQYGDTPIGKSGWWLLTKDVLPGSRRKSVEAHKAMIVDLAKKTGLPYEQASLVVALAGMIARYVSSGERLFSDEPWTYTSVVEQVNGVPCYAGGFGSSGPRVYDYFFVFDYPGAAAALSGGSAEVF